MNIVQLKTLAKMAPGAKALRTLKRITKPTGRLLQMQKREMEYVPKYLELAMSKGIDRFTPAQINELTASFGKYVTNGSKTDMLKELLEIGSKKGETLSFEEMQSVLDMTSGMEATAQNRVIRFVRRTKEDLLKPKMTSFGPKDFREVKPLEEFRERELYHKATTPFGRACPEFYTDAAIKERYDRMIEQDVRMYSNPYYRKYLSKVERGPELTDYISKGNLAFVESIATCENPEALADLTRLLGVVDSTTYSANSMIKLMDMGANKSLLLTISDRFYPFEIDQIAEALAKKGGAVRSKMQEFDYLKIEVNEFDEALEKAIKKGNIEHFQFPKSPVSKINRERKAILKALGIDKDITLLELKASKERAPRQLDGDCGRGKNNR